VPTGVSYTRGRIAAHIYIKGLQIKTENKKIKF